MPTSLANRHWALCHQGDLHVQVVQRQISAVFQQGFCYVACILRASPCQRDLDKLTQATPLCPGSTP